MCNSRLRKCTERCWPDGRTESTEKDDVHTQMMACLQFRSSCLLIQILKDSLNSSSSPNDTSDQSVQCLKDSLNSSSFTTEVGHTPESVAISHMHGTAKGPRSSSQKNRRHMPSSKWQRYQYQVDRIRMYTRRMKSTEASDAELQECSRNPTQSWSHSDVDAKNGIDGRIPCGSSGRKPYSDTK